MKPTLLVPRCLPFDHEAVPAVAGQVGDGQRGDGDGAHAPLGTNAGVAGESFDLDHHPVAAGRADRHLLAGAAVPVEAHRRLAEQALLHVAGAVQADFFLDEPAERERRVRQLVLQDFQSRR